MESSVLEFFKESHLLSFQVEFSSSIHRLRFPEDNAKVKRTWYKGILDIDFDMQRCVIRDEGNMILTQSFTGFQKQGSSEDETDQFMTLTFRHDEWQIIPQNIAEAECIRHVTQYISDDQSVRIEDILKSGVNKGVIGLDHAHVLKHGLVQQCDSNGIKLKLRFLVLIPGKLFGFQEIEGQRAFLVSSLFNAKVTTLPEVPGFQLHFDTSDPLYFNPVQEEEQSSWTKELNASIDLIKHAVGGVLVTQQENSRIGDEDGAKQEEIFNGMQKPLHRESQLIVTPEQARQLSMLKKPVSRARLCLADSLSELEALLGHIKTSNTLSELDTFYTCNTNKRNGKRFYSPAPTRWNSGREKRNWGYNNSTRRSSDDLCLQSPFSRRKPFGYTPKYNMTNTTYSTNHNGTGTRLTPLRSSREGLYNTEAQVRHEPVLAEGTSSFRSSMEGTSRVQSSLFCLQDPSISLHETHPYIEEQRTSQQGYPSNDLDSSPYNNQQSRKGSGDFPELVQFSETQNKDDSNNALLNRKSTIKLVSSRQPNRVAFSPQLEIRELPDDDSVEMSQEGEDNTQNASDVPPVMNGGYQSTIDPSSKLSKTYDNTQQLLFDIEYYSPRNKSKDEFQEMQQAEKKNRSSIKLTEVQPYDQSQVQSVNSNQIVADAMGSVEPRASVPRYPNEEFNTAAYSHHSPDSQSSGSGEDEMDANVEGSVARKSVYIGSRQSQEPISRTSIQERNTTANYGGSSIVNGRQGQPINELSNQPNIYTGERQYMHQDCSTEEVDPMYSRGKSHFQGEPSPFEISSESSASSEMGDVQGLDSTFPDLGTSRHNSADGIISENSVVPIPTGGRKSRFIVSNGGLQNILPPVFGEGSKLRFDVRDEVIKGRKSRFDVMDENPQGSFLSRKSLFSSQDKEPSTPIFAAEGRKSRFISQDKDPLTSGFAAEARKSRFIAMDEEPQMTARPIMAAEGRKSRHQIKKEEDPSTDYQRSLITTEPTRSSKSLGNSDAVSQKSPQLSEIRKSRVSFESEDAPPSTCQRCSSIGIQPSTTRQSMRTYDMVESNYNEVPAPSNYQNGVSVTHSASSSSSSQSSDGAQVEYSQTPRVTESRKSRMIVEKDNDDAESRKSRLSIERDHQRSSISSQPSSTTQSSMQSFNIVEPDDGEAFAYTQSGSRKSKFIFRDEAECAVSPQVVPVIFGGRKSRFLFSDGKPPFIAEGRKSRIITDRDDEDMAATLDYRRDLSVSHSVRSNSSTPTFDGVQLERPETPLCSEIRKSTSMEGEEYDLASDYQRNSLTSMQYVDMIDPMSNEVVTSSDYQRSSTSSHSRNTRTSMRYIDTIEPKESEVRSDWNVNNEAATLSNYQGNSTSRHSFQLYPRMFEGVSDDAVTSSEYQRNLVSNCPSTTQSSMQYLDIVEPNENEVLDQSRDHQRNSTSSRPSAFRPVTQGFDTVDPNDSKVLESSHLRKSEWSLSNDPATSSDNERNMSVARPSSFRAST